MLSNQTKEFGMVDVVASPPSLKARSCFGIKVIGHGLKSSPEVDGDRIGMLVAEG